MVSKDQDMAIVDVAVEGDRPSTPKRHGPTVDPEIDVLETPKSPTPVNGRMSFCDVDVDFYKLCDLLRRFFYHGCIPICKQVWVVF